MDLYTVQLVFYTLGIIFMFSLIILVIALIYVLFQIKNTVEKAVDTARESVQELRENTVGRIETLVSDNKMKIAGTVGAGVLGFVAKQIGKMVKGKKS